MANPNRPNANTEGLTPREHRARALRDEAARAERDREGHVHEPDCPCYACQVSRSVAYAAAARRGAPRQAQRFFNAHDPYAHLPPERRP